MTDRPLAGKIAFVTGSGRGLGRAMADKLAALGADVAIHDRDAEQPAKYGEASSLDEVAREIGRHGGRVTTVLGNIGDPRGGGGDVAHDRRRARRRGHPGQLRRRRHRRRGRQARPQQRARHRARGHPGRDAEQPDRDDAGHAGLRAPDARPAQRLRREHRVRRGPLRHSARGRLLDAEGGRRALHPLPGRRAAASTACA